MAKNISVRFFLIFFLVFAFPAGADAPKPIPDFKLTNQNGKSFKLHDLKTKYLLLSFIFTRCPMPEMCPLTISLSKRTYQQWQAQPSFTKTGFPLHFLFVTLDPEYDTPARLLEYAKVNQLDPELFTLATGTPDTLTDLAREFNVVGLPADGTISHNLKTILLSPLMIPIKEFKDNQWSPDEVLALMRRSIVWWGWFFVAASALAIPGLVLIFRIKRFIKN